MLEMATAGVGAVMAAALVAVLGARRLLDRRIVAGVLSAMAMGRGRYTMMAGRLCRYQSGAMWAIIRTVPS